MARNVVDAGFAKIESSIFRRVDRLLGGLRLNAASPAVTASTSGKSETSDNDDRCEGPFHRASAAEVETLDELDDYFIGQVGIVGHLRQVDTLQLLADAILVHLLAT